MRHVRFKGLENIRLSLDQKGKSTALKYDGFKVMNSEYFRTGVSKGFQEISSMRGGILGGFTESQQYGTS